MIKGGIIIVHDYFSSDFTGVKEAVSIFEKENNIMPLPVGDSISIAIQKK